MVLIIPWLAEVVSFSFHLNHVSILHQKIMHIPPFVACINVL